MGRSLGSQREVYSILEDLHAQLLSGKATSIRGVGKTIMSREDGGRHMPFEDFCHAVVDTLGLYLNEDELAKVFSGYDDKETGTIDFNRFLSGVRGELSPARLQLVDQVYSLLDPAALGYIDVETFRANFNGACDQGLSDMQHLIRPLASLFFFPLSLWIQGFDVRCVKLCRGPGLF